MRLIVLVFALWGLCAASASARPYLFTFQSDVSAVMPGEYLPGWAVGREAIIEARIVLDLPTLENLTYEAFFFRQDTPDPSYVSGIARSGDVWSDGYMGAHIRFATNAAGQLTDAFALFADDTPDFALGLRGAEWGDAQSTYYRASGAWSVAPAAVPLPGAAALLVAAFAALGLFLRRVKA